MNTLLETLLHHTPWMTTAERTLAQSLLQQFRADLSGRGIPDTPTLAFRLQDLAIAYLLVQRAEACLTQDGLEPSLGGIAKTPGAALDCIGRARQRLNKSLRELEDFCKRATQPAPRSARATGAGATGDAAPPTPQAPAEAVLTHTTPKEPSPTAKTRTAAPASQPSAPTNERAAVRPYSNACYVPRTPSRPTNRPAPGD